MDRYAVTGDLPHREDRSRYAVIVVDLRTGDPRRLPGYYVGDKGRDQAHRDAAKKSDDVTHRAWVVVLHRG